VASYVIGVDIGGTNIRIAAVDYEGRILSEIKYPNDASSECEYLIENLLKSFRELAKILDGEPDGIGLGVAGIIKLQEGVISEAPNLPKFKDFNIKATLQRETKIPIFVDNDANAAALGEKWMGAGRGIADFCCLTLGTGIGGGIILNGEIWHGMDGVAGEVGHMIIEYREGAMCNCGNRGCLEAHASATAVTRMAREAIKQGKKTILVEQCKGNLSEINSKMIYESAKMKDPLSIGVLREMGRYLGVGVANLVNLLNLELVILAGRLTEAWDYFIHVTLSEIERCAFRVPAERVRVVKAECGDNAGVLGSAYLTIQGLKCSK
jgi:glucokinase